MNDSSPKIRSISYESSERMVRAWVADEKGTGFYPLTFPIAAIDGVVGINENGSGLVLRSGIKIPVTLPQENLEQLIYTFDFKSAQPMLDLRSVTGKTAQDILFPELAKKFEPETMVPQNRGMKITAFLRKDGTNEFVAHEFFEKDIASLEPFETERSKCEKSIKIKFNAAATKGPFGNCKANLDMPHEDFIIHLSNAKTYGYSQLDLCTLFKDYSDTYGLKPQ